jgi:hypothetical protein
MLRSITGGRWSQIVTARGFARAGAPVAPRTPAARRGTPREGGGGGEEPPSRDRRPGPRQGRGGASYASFLLTRAGGGLGQANNRFKFLANSRRPAGRALFARHHVRVYRFVLRLVRDESLAEDLISEVFLDVWRQASRFERRSSVGTWLLAIGRHKALSALRRRPGQTLDEERAAAIEDPADDPEIAVQKKDKSEILTRSSRRTSSGDHTGKRMRWRNLGLAGEIFIHRDPTVCQVLGDRPR